MLSTLAMLFASAVVVFQPLDRSCCTRSVESESESRLKIFAWWLQGDRSQAIDRGNSKILENLKADRGFG